MISTLTSSTHARQSEKFAYRPEKVALFLSESRGRNDTTRSAGMCWAICPLKAMAEKPGRTRNASRLEYGHKCR